MLCSANIERDNSYLESISKLASNKNELFYHAITCYLMYKMYIINTLQVIGMNCLSILYYKNEEQKTTQKCKVREQITKRTSSINTRPHARQHLFIIIILTICC